MAGFDAADAHDSAAPIDAGEQPVDSAYAIKLMRETGKVLSESQVSILRKRCGDDVKAAGDLYRALTEQTETTKEDDVDDAKLAGEKTEDIAYRDEFWDKEERRWRLEQQNENDDDKKLEGSTLVVRQRFTEKMTPCETVIDIRGPKLAGIMRNIYRDADGVNLAGAFVTLGAEYFFWARHYLRQARDYAAKNDEAETLREVEIGLKFIQQHWPRNKADEMITNGIISWDYLWAIFPPNVLVVGRHVLDDVRVYSVKHHTKYKKQDGTIVLSLTSDYGEYDGRLIGLAQDNLTIPHFPGTMPIEQLPFSPLHMHSQRDEIWETILTRTKKQFSLFQRPFQLQEHEGLGLVQFRDQDYDWVDPQRFKFNGRVMIDPLRMTHAEPEMLIPKVNSLGTASDVKVAREAPNGKLLSIEDIMKISDTPAGADDKMAGGKMQSYLSMRDDDYSSAWSMEQSVKKNTRSSNSAKVSYEDLTDVQRVLFSGLVHGYSLADARWGAFSVDNVQEVEWNRGAFQSLVMEPELKELVCRLIKSQHEAAYETDDFVRGKGKGLIGLLFGKPGLGKTLTAEAIAETAETPLFMIASGTLGHTADKISEKLTTMLDLAAHWRAVLLLDEADVFLMARKDNDLERNAIVSVFLQQLEYYQGILIMTTNRAETIDPAFQSRIHFCYQYPDLDRVARRHIWQTFLDKSKSDGKIKVGVSDKDIGELAEIDYNGRQIKNVHSIAAKLAAVSEDKTLTKDGILKAIRMLQNFIPGMHV
ncbi:P-loop containing nucleoside triphosphate hydrolase protein [Myriangium duriaei CBS 260.36]|uniref:P-loop containing nucleoside triphosphate hydrolase protein n=1 Tax=Myriangium duriaei CBS 260.36 TaxID=1168546 RepID=A0A9P4MMX6_9PEZI|nr:P-loop containing nucleoside triphosphate hydrolase protein [Myriangium duriaei CBS 260.36]